MGTLLFLATAARPELDRTFRIDPFPTEYDENDISKLMNDIAGLNCVESVKLPLDEETGVSKGYAFVMIYPHAYKEFKRKIRTQKKYASLVGSHSVKIFEPAYDA